MNLVAFAGYWFYGAADTPERASLFSSYGLLIDAPSPTVVTITKRIWDWFWEFF